MIWILWRQSHIFLEVEVLIICLCWLNLIVSHIKSIAVESKCSQSRYFFFEVVYFLYLSDVDVRGLLFISIEELEEGFGGHFFKPLMKSHRMQAYKVTFILLN